MRLLFTICGRAGSKGFKNKNIKKMNGIPLVYYTLAAIRLYAEKHTDTVETALNTDSYDLEELVRDQHIVEGVKFVQRKESLAGDLIPKVEVIRDTYLTLKNGADYDAVVDLDLTSPMRSAFDIENAVEEYFANEDYDLVLSVVKGRRNPYFNVVEKRESFFHKVCDSDYVARQEAPDVYELNASIYVYNPRFLEKEIKKTILEYKCGVSLMKDYLVLDIDSEDDFEMMEYLHKYYSDSDTGIREIYELARDMI